jgi:hypothetical protein
MLQIALLSQYNFAAEKDMFIDNKVVTPVEFFVDRTDEIKEISQNLQLHKIVSLVGVTSIGKTEILRKYAIKNQDKYELIWFFDLSCDLNEQFVSLAKKINQTLLLTSKEKISQDANLAQEDTINFLTGRKNWLLVFDNLKLGQSFANICNLLEGEIIAFGRNAPFSLNPFGSFHANMSLDDKDEFLKCTKSLLEIMCGVGDDARGSAEISPSKYQLSVRY